MRTSTLRVFFSAALLISMGCTKADPGFGVLDANNVPQPLFDGQSTKTLQSHTALETPNISGSCDYKIRGIIAQLIDIDSSPGTLDHIATGSPSVTCQTDGKFSFQLNSLTALSYALVEGKTYEIQLRALTSAGISKPSSLYIHYSTSTGTGPKHMVITSGGTLSGSGQRIVASTNYKAVIRIDHRMPDYASPGTAGAMTTQTSSSSSYKLKMGTAASAD